MDSVGRGVISIAPTSLAVYSAPVAINLTVSSFFNDPFMTRT